MSDPGPMARLEALKADANAPSVIFQRLAERETLKDIAKEWGLPKGRFCEWFTTTFPDIYDAALKVVAAELALEALAISDAGPRQAVGADGAPLFHEDGKPWLVEPDVGRDRLRADTRLKLAAKFDRFRFGESVRVEKTVTVTADQALLGTAAALLDKVRALPTGRVIEAERPALAVMDLEPI